MAVRGSCADKQQAGVLSPTLSHPNPFPALRVRRRKSQESHYKDFNYHLPNKVLLLTKPTRSPDPQLMQAA